MRETLRFTGKIMSATVSRAADRWFVSITIDTPEDLPLPKAENQGAEAVDLGVSALATLSTGEKVEGLLAKLPSTRQIEARSSQLESISD